MDSKSWNGDSLGALTAIGLCASLMASVLLLAPAIAGQLIVKLGFSEPQAGYTISAELAGISLASFPAMFWLRRANWRTVSYISLLWVALGNLVSAFCVDFETLATARFLTALGAGNVMLITMLAAAGGENSERSYSVWLVGQLALGAVGLAVLPAFFASFTLREFYIVLAILALAITILVSNLPEQLAQSQDSTDAEVKSGPIWLSLIGLMGLLLYYIAIGGTWTFAEQIGVGLGTNRPQIGLILSIATIAGIMGALIPPILRAFVSRWISVLCGTGLLTISIFSLSLQLDWIGFGIAAIGFKFAWTFTVPYILSVLAGLDRNGVVIAASNVLIGLGLAVGPFVASGVLSFSGEYAAMLMAMGSAALASAVLLVLSSSISASGSEDHAD